MLTYHYDKYPFAQKTRQQVFLLGDRPSLLHAHIRSHRAQVPVLLVHLVLIHRSVVKVLLVPHIVRLEYYVPVDAGVNKQHNYGDDHDQREDGEQYAFKQIFTHMLSRMSTADAVISLS